MKNDLENQKKYAEDFLKQHGLYRSASEQIEKGKSDKVIAYNLMTDLMRKFSPLPRYQLNDILKEKKIKFHDLVKDFRELSGFEKKPLSAEALKHEKRKEELISKKKTKDLIHPLLKKFKEDEELDYIEELKHKYQKGHKDIYFRSGPPPEGGRSYNFRENHYEEGVSVYPNPTHTSFAGNTAERDWYMGAGEVVGIGSDGEPLIKPIGKWHKYFNRKGKEHYENQIEAADFLIQKNPSIFEEGKDIIESLFSSFRKKKEKSVQFKDLEKDSELMDFYSAKAKKAIGYKRNK